MATSMRRRGVAVTAFALASGTSLAAFGTAAPAGASSTHAPAYYQGVTSANVLSVVSATRAGTANATSAGTVNLL